MSIFHTNKRWLLYFTLIVILAEIVDSVQLDAKILF